MVYVRGVPSISQTLAKCLGNIADPVLYPGYSLAVSEPTVISVQFAINNLITVDEVQNLVSFDFFFRTYWTDSRLSMPPLWAALNRNDSKLGVEIDPLLHGYQTVNGYQFGFWVPDFIFIDALSCDVQLTSVKLYPNGSIAMSQHIVITLMQSGFLYNFYPDDTQTLQLRVASYVLNNNQLQVQAFSGLPIVLYSSVDDELSFTLNPIWAFIKSYFKVVIENNGTPGRPRLRSTAVVSLVVQRYSRGIVFRLAIPMFLLVLLAGIAFWAEPVDRMNVSITILLSISALYIVVFQNIPMIGILTSFDKYVIIIGRIFVIPVIIIVFFLYFPSAFRVRQKNSIIVLYTIWSVFLIAREGRSCIVQFHLAMNNIKSKIEHLSNLSSYEILVFNRYTYGVFSFSMTRHLKEVQDL